MSVTDQLMILNLSGKKENIIIKDGFKLNKIFYLNVYNSKNIEMFKEWNKLIYSDIEFFINYKFCKDLVIEYKNKFYGFSNCVPCEILIDVDGSMNVKISYHQEIMDHPYIIQEVRRRKIKKIL